MKDPCLLSPSLSVSNLVVVISMVTSFAPPWLPCFIHLRKCAIENYAWTHHIKPWTPLTFTRLLLFHLFHIPQKCCLSIGPLQWKRSKLGCWCYRHNYGRSIESRVKSVFCLHFKKWTLAQSLFHLPSNHCFGNRGYKCSFQNGSDLEQACK